VPRLPRLRHVLREAVSDFYYHSLSFLGANIALGVLVMAVLVASPMLPLALLIAALLPLPAAGIMRMATRLLRDYRTDLGDFADVLRRPWPVLGIGLAQLGLTVVLVGDALIAAAWRSWPGTILLVGAAYGLLALWTVALVAWPLLLDPERDGVPIRPRLRLALVVILLHPARIGGFALLMGALVVLAGVLVAPLLTFMVALIWLAVARWVLPIADRVEGRETMVVEGAEPASGKGRG
jgi:hypothetical protein